MSSFFKFQSTCPPVITADDLANVTMLLACFDRITFNTNGEIVATLTTEFPIIGPVMISLYDRENHIMVYRGKEAANDESMWSGYIHDIDHDFEGKYDRDILIMKIRSVLRDEIAKQLV